MSQFQAKNCGLLQLHPAKNNLTRACITGGEKNTALLFEIEEKQFRKEAHP